MQLCFIGGLVWRFGWWFWKMGVSSMQGINHTWKHFLKIQSNGDSLLTQNQIRPSTCHFHFDWNFHIGKLQYYSSSHNHMCNSQQLTGVIKKLSCNCSCSSSSSSSSSRRGWSAPCQAVKKSQNQTLDLWSFFLNWLRWLEQVNTNTERAWGGPTNIGFPTTKRQSLVGLDFLGMWLTMVESVNHHLQQKPKASIDACRLPRSCSPMSFGSEGRQPCNQIWLNTIFCIGCVSGCWRCQESNTSTSIT